MDCYSYEILNYISQNFSNKHNSRKLNNSLSQFNKYYLKQISSIVKLISNIIPVFDLVFKMNWSLPLYF